MNGWVSISTILFTNGSVGSFTSHKNQNLFARIH